MKQTDDKISFDIGFGTDSVHLDISKAPPDLQTLALLSIAESMARQTQSMLRIERMLEKLWIRTIGRG